MLYLFQRELLVENTTHGQVFSTVVDGPQQALLSLGWDIYCIQIHNKLPHTIVEKMIKNRTFQSFRYEVAIAAIMVRAGYEVNWYEACCEGEPKGEFIAIHTETGLKLTVEAKSLHRKGVLHEAGELDPADTKAKRIAKLLKNAEKKKEKGIPHAIFIDINRPPNPSNLQSDLDYIKLLIRHMSPIPSAKKPAKHDVLFITNFSPHYGGVGKQLPQKRQYFSVFPRYCADHMNIELYHDIQNSLDHYSHIPDEIN
ncbi:MAG: hypothetical protein WB791_08520 [Waddliaceae bacterium]